MSITLAQAQANLTALSQADMTGALEVEQVTEAGTRRVKFRTSNDLHAAIMFWDRAVARLSRRGSKKRQTASADFTGNHRAQADWDRSC